MFEGPGIYKHFKGPLYEVYFVARHSETEDELVVYRELYGHYLYWVRPVAMFNERVKVDGKLIPRFELVSTPQ